MPTHTALPALLPYEFAVEGSPVSVNRYGQLAYRNWRAKVQAASISSARWTGALTSTPTTVHIRYFWHLDRRKDVDNILKAILDGLDGKTGSSPKHPIRVLEDDRDVERVMSQRTKIDFSTRFRGRSLTIEEFSAVQLALSGQASVFVSVTHAPDHNRSVTR